MSILHIIILAVIQGFAELLPVSSSAHVIVAEKAMGLDPSSPEMTFLLVMLHTGTMGAVLLYFWPRWKEWKIDFLKMVIIATAVTGVIGLALKKFIEKVVFGYMLGQANGEVEHLFKSLPLISLALFLVGILIWYSGTRESKVSTNHVSKRNSIIIGVVQGLCLPFRGFSRSGATISTAMLGGVSRGLAEDFSFALAVLLTPPVIVLELHRLLKAAHTMPSTSLELGTMLLPGMLGMVFSFIAGLFALRWLSAWLERGRWKYFGMYCILFSIVVFTLNVTYM